MRHMAALWYYVLALAFLNTLYAVAQAASFDCTRAATVVEQTICRHPELSTLDDQMMSAYASALAQAPNPDTVKTRQRAWLASERNRCRTVACLQEQYTQRIAALQALGATAPVRQTVTGTYERVYHGKPDPHTATLTIRAQPDGRLHVSGNAVWVGNVRTGNVNVGEVDGIFTLSGNTVHYTDAEAKDGCAFTIAFSPNALLVTDDTLRCGGFNVTFNGQYRRVPSPKTR